MRVTNMELTNYQRALVIIHKLENQFGSISKVPESDPEMQEIHRLLPMGRQSVETDFELAERLSHLGYSNSYIARNIHCNLSTLLDYFKKHLIKHKQTFHYKVVAPNQSTVYYVDSLLHFYKVVFYKTAGSSKDVELQLHRQGYATKCSNFVWSKVPNGAFYLTRGTNYLHTKDGIDSYIYPDA